MEEVEDKVLQYYKVGKYSEMDVLAEDAEVDSDSLSDDSKKTAKRSAKADK
jgi:hypothetical protein